MAPYVLVVTDEHRSLIASAFVGTRGKPELSLCCGPRERALDACAVIVGPTFCAALRTFFYERLGCTLWPTDAQYDADYERTMLAKIAALDVLVEEHG